MSDVLGKIAAATRRRVDAAKTAVSEKSLRERLKDSLPPPSFKEALQASGLRVIAEIKRASPSEGPIAKSLDAAETAAEYESYGAAALSVLTEPGFFSGSLDDLEAAGERSRLPRLMKDFVLDEYQLIQARLAGAAAALLIVAMIGKDETQRLLKAARGLGIDCLVEVHDAQEADAAAQAGADIIGVNNRNLRTLKVDLDVSRRLAPRLKGAGKVLVAESGLTRKEDLLSLKDAGFDAFLIGTHLIKSGRPGPALSELIS